MFESFLTVLVSDIKESQNIALLHNQIAACDSILEVRHGPGPRPGRSPTVPSLLVLQTRICERKVTPLRSQFIVELILFFIFFYLRNFIVFVMLPRLSLVSVVPPWFSGRLILLEENCL